MEISTSLPHVEHVMDGKKVDSRGRAMLVKALSAVEMYFPEILLLNLSS